MNESSIVGLVVIGRNEARHLERCLLSAGKQTKFVVYVDSGSIDQSTKIADSLGALVVELSPDTPFSAARARNEGFRSLINQYNGIHYVQFVDGDCELAQGWLDCAVDFMEKNKKYALVCGRRKEFYPERSIYNQLCNIEWDTPIGETDSCGGDFLVRTKPFQDVGGFREDIIAGEEPELCLRLRSRGHYIFRIDNLMTMHDANMVTLSQWWLRCKRSGFATMNSWLLHGSESNASKQILSIGGWSLVFVLSMIAGIICSKVVFIGLSLIPVKIVQLAKSKAIGERAGNAKWLYSTHLICGKLPEFVGIVTCLLQRALKKKTKIIEYK